MPPQYGLRGQEAQQQVQQQPTGPMRDRSDNGMYSRLPQTGNAAAKPEAQGRGWSAPESLRGEGMPNPNPGGKHFASELRANIARAEWNDWRNRFLPVFQELRDSVNNPEVMAGAEQRAIDNTQRGFQLGRGAADDTMRRYGLQLRPDEQQAMNRKFALNQAGTEAGLVTQARRHVRDRDLAVMAGGLNGTRGGGG